MACISRNERSVRLRGGLLLLCLCCAQASGELISRFQAGTGGWHLGTLGIGNLDNDSALEIVVPYRDASGGWFLDAYDFDGVRVPGFPYASGGEEMNVSPTLVDLDGDGRDEILITQANKVVALRGNGTTLWSTAIDSLNYVPDAGYQTVTNGFWWSNGRTFRSRLPTTAVFSSQVSSPIVADVHANGSKLVITGWKIDPDSTSGEQDFNPFIGQTYGYIEWGLSGETWSGGVVFFDAITGLRNSVYHQHQLVESGLALGRADTDAPLETYVLSDSDSVVCFDKSRPHGLWGKGMLHKQFGKNQRFMSGSYQAGIDLHVADLDGDGRDEVLVAGTQLSRLWEPNETILDDDGAILWRKWLPQVSIDNQHGWLNSAAMIPINPDGDNHIDVLSFNHSHEIAFRYWNGTELVDRAGWPKNFAPYLPSTPVVGDVDGGGDEEIVIGTYNPSATLSDGQLLIFALDGTLKTSVAVPGGLKHIPSLADVNVDGRLDVIYRSLNGEVFVQNFGATGTNRVSWATHRGNQRRDGNQNVSLFHKGAPKITGKSAGYRKAAFSWTNDFAAKVYRIYKAEQSSGPFAHIATLTSNVVSHADYSLKPGWPYFYELEADYGSNRVRAAPFCILPLANSNLLANAGFEENDNSHWDKWFTDHVAQTNMSGSATAFQGRRGMAVKLVNSASSSTISQFNQYGIPDSSIPVTAGVSYSFGGWLKNGGTDRPYEQWWEWTSDKDANTNNRPLLPWPDSFTPHFVTPTNRTEWVYANRVFFMPAGLPTIQYRHRYSASAPVNGVIHLDNAFFRELPQPASTVWSNLISLGATWSYFTNTPPTGWFTRGFDDSSWLRSAAKFGAGSGPRDVVTRLPSRRPAYYFRRQFTMNFPEAQELLLEATCTDSYGGKVYPLRLFLNDTEVVTSGIEAVTGQGNDLRYFDLHPFTHLLKEGINTIGVILQNTWATDFDDVAFNIALKALPYQGGRERLRFLNTEPEVMLECLTPPGTIWQLRAGNALSGLPWQALDVFTNDTGASRTITDSRPKDGTRFYQLAPF